jgi:hypothetical protein
LVTLLYDGDGNRVGKNTTRYLVDDLNPTGYAQVVEDGIYRLTNETDSAHGAVSYVYT